MGSWHELAIIEAMEPESPLPPGTYEVVVVDASGGPSSMALEFLITVGEHKGDIVNVQARGEGRPDYELLGMPAQLIVGDSETPSVHWQ